MNPIEFAVNAAGGRVRVAKAFGISYVAIYKWINNASLPRTEYTGKTAYAKKLSELSNGEFTAEWLLKTANPDRDKHAPDTQHADA